MASSSPKHAFVTGATGFLGRNLVEQLAKRGWKITALYRTAERFELLKRWDVNGVRGSLQALDDLTEAVPEGVDAVFHMAADTTTWLRHGSRQLQTNVDGTRNVVAAAERKGAKRFVFTSSWRAWGFQRRDSPPERGNATERQRIAGTVRPYQICGRIDCETGCHRGTARCNHESL